MSYIRKEPTAFIDIRLTDTGRYLAATGQLKFAKAVVSDREIDYSVIRQGYNPFDNRIIEPKDYQPPLTVNLDDTNPIVLFGTNIQTEKKVVTATTIQHGLFSANTASSGWTLNASYVKARAVISSAVANTNRVTLGSVTNVIGSPSTGDTLLILWEPPSVAGAVNTYPTILSGRPINALWYTVISASTGNTYYLDRNIPNFSSFRAVPAIFYSSSAGTYWSSYSADPGLWCMNIVRTSSVEGSINSITSGYTSYGSIEFNGIKHYMGFSSETKTLGILHYTNRYSGNTYAEQFLEQSFVLTLPLLMWHGKNQNNGISTTFGSSFYDYFGTTYYDSFAKTTYRELRDSLSANSLVVGRVYHKLKIAVITHPELLAALTYKSNRCYTLPELNLSLLSGPPHPYVFSGLTSYTGFTSTTRQSRRGLCKSGYTYFVTYLTESISANTGSQLTFGYQNALHCTNIQKIEGQTDINNQPMFLNASFTSGFPFLRGDTPTSGTYAGTGWVAHKVQILMQEHSNDDRMDIDRLPHDRWVRVSSISGNGIYESSTSVGSIDPNVLANENFIITYEDYESGTTYSIGSALTMNQSWLNFGDEIFLQGNIDVSIVSTAYKASWYVNLPINGFNSSNNPSFDPSINKDTYITEIGILDEQNKMVAIGKPTYPLKKNTSRFLKLQLDMDF